MRVAPPRTAKTPSPGKWNGNREAHRADCVRIVHKHRNLLAHAPDRLHEEVSADYTDMIYAATPNEVAERRKAFLRKWRLKCRAVADSLEEAGDKLFTFTRLPPSQWDVSSAVAKATTSYFMLLERKKSARFSSVVVPCCVQMVAPFSSLAEDTPSFFRTMKPWPS